MTESALMLAERHADAIADTGDGYVVQRCQRALWRIDCLWCEWAVETATKRAAVAQYRDHEDQLMTLLRRQLRGRNALV